MTQWMKSHGSTYVRGVPAVCLLLALAACAADVQSDPPQMDDLPMASRQLLAEVNVSDTHYVKFWEYEVGMVMVEQDWDIDVDQRVELDTYSRSLAELYRDLVDEPDAATLTALKDADRRLSEVRLNREAAGAPAPEEEVVEWADAFEAASGEVSSAASDEELVPKHHGCPSPLPSGWSWSDDNDWFAENFCFSCSNGTSATCQFPVDQLCNTSVTFAERTWRRAVWYRSYGFGQAFCNTARHQVAWRHDGGLFGGSTTLLVTDKTVSARHINESTWTAGDDYDWWSRIDGNSGSQPKRAGLGVQRKKE